MTDTSSTILVSNLKNYSRPKTGKLKCGAATPNEVVRQFLEDRALGHSRDLGSRGLEQCRRIMYEKSLFEHYMFSTVTTKLYDSDVVQVFIFIISVRGRKSSLKFKFGVAEKKL